MQRPANNNNINSYPEYSCMYRYIICVYMCVCAFIHGSVYVCVYQMLIGMWRKDLSFMQVNWYTHYRESNLAISSETKNVHTLRSSNFSSKNIVQRNSCKCAPGSHILRISTVVFFKYKRRNWKKLDVIQKE